MRLTPNEWALISGFGGVVIGGLLTTFSNLWQAGRQYKYQREHTFTASQRDAYLEVLTWFALVRDGLRESIGGGKRWNGTDVTDRRESARADALAEMYGSEPFREATSRWQPAYQELVRAHDGWLFIYDQTPANQRRNDESLTRAETELQERMATLAKVLLAIQQVARREAGRLASRGAFRG